MTKLAIYERKVQRIQTTAWLSLPKPWVAARGIRKGDVLAVTVEADGSLRVEPFTEDDAHDS